MSGPGVSFHIDVDGLSAAIAKLNGDPLRKQELMDGLGKLGVEQTKKRIEEEKTTPEGRAWRPNREGTSTLFSGGGAHLARSIDYASSESEARWGSGWVGARILHFGGAIVPVNAKALAFQAGGKLVFAKRVTIPARQYVGLSRENETEMIETAERFEQQTFGGAS
jgi:phage gpG-like protein